MMKKVNKPYIKNQEELGIRNERHRKAGIGEGLILDKIL
jgi:hypothetical protein